MRKAKKLFLSCVVAFAMQHALHAATPKLIVTILVDQLRYDYLERFQDQFTTNGFRLFLDQGAFMTFAHYNYVPTITGPGHASYLSGATPMMHGIIGNDWLDRNTGREVYCVGDQSVQGVGIGPGQGRSSPRNFIGGNFSDELRLRYRSKVISVSLKDRAAILPGGKKPAGAYWFDSGKGNFYTSSYYMETLPSWVQEFNKRKRAAEFVGKTWERLVDEKFYLYPDSAAGEGTLAEEKKPIFNHKVAKSDSGFDNIVSSPFGNQILEEFAEAAIEGEKLGQDNKPDLLCVSFSSIDAVGHKFGPYSQEVQDMTLRLDRQLAQLFSYIDQKIGLTNVMLTLTADHAVAPTPEFAKEQGLDGQRVSEGDFMSDIKEQLAEEYGPGRYFLSSRMFGGHIYLNHATLEKKKIKVEDVVSLIREAALKSGKFQACYSRAQLLDGRVSDPLGRLVLNGYNAERGGDLVLLMKPYFMPGSGKTGTTHGSGYSYDTHVPIMFYGAAFKSGRYADEFDITDIVPTLCSALHMNEPAGCVGKPLVRLLAEP